MSLPGNYDFTVSASERALNIAISRLDEGGSIDFPTCLRSATEDLILKSKRSSNQSSLEKPWRVLAYVPVAQANKFQALLYSRAGPAGVQLLPLLNFDELEQLPLFSNLVVHFHWFGDVVAGAKSKLEARGRVAAFLDRIDLLKHRCNPTFLWTAHNLIPHDSSFPDVDLELRQEIIDRCSAVHCLTENSVETLGRKLQLSRSKTFVVGHPSYVNAYPDFTDQLTARDRLGIGPEDRVILGFGAIKQYKGYDMLTAAFDILSAKQEDEGKPFHLLIAGAGKGRDVESIADWATGRDDVTLIPRTISDEDLQYVFRASDVTACPYKMTLNSGVAILSLGFGVPIVAPSTGAFSELGENGILTYQPDTTASEIADLLDFASRNSEQVTRGISGFNTMYQPAIVSENFFQNISSLWSSADGGFDAPE